VFQSQLENPEGAGGPIGIAGSGQPFLLFLADEEVCADVTQDAQDKQRSGNQRGEVNFHCFSPVLAYFCTLFGYFPDSSNN